MYNESNLLIISILVTTLISNITLTCALSVALRSVSDLT